MIKKSFLSFALSILLILSVLTSTALAAGETSATPKSVVSIQYVYINQASTSRSLFQQAERPLCMGMCKKHRPEKTFISHLLCSVILTDHGQM
ncbi:hypothetical protein [Caldicellulosiruptor saccharolyticus]|uniref:hypothetical protein n=1 Tax=Caldicellulosiruptor saccharolyticus TaxID=44001 RepID=UPI001E306837|nr:hypothetical protein [Caldicellulosiruptor saccharolyticus]